MQLTTQFILSVLCSVVLCYLLGSLSFAIIVSKCIAKKDIREFGSGNAGMTNVLRTLGKGPAALTLLGDIGKAVVGVFLSRLLLTYWGGVPQEYLTMFLYLAGIFVVLGHIYPVYYGFHGGKGIATSAGVLLMVDPIVFAGVVAVFLVVVLISKIVSLASICAAVSAPVITYVSQLLLGDHALLDALCVLVFAVLVIIMHRSNIKRLANGTENKFGKKK